MRVCVCVCVCVLVTQQNAIQQNGFSLNQLAYYCSNELVWIEQADRGFSAESSGLEIKLPLEPRQNRPIKSQEMYRYEVAFETSMVFWEFGVKITFLKEALMLWNLWSTWIPMDRP